MVERVRSRTGKRSTYVCWLTWRGPLLADWATRYHHHPFRNNYTADERDLLTDELVSDPTTRIYSKLSGGLPVDTWAQLKLTALVASALGVEARVPTPDVGRMGNPVGERHARELRARLAAYSAVANLPEE